MLEREEKPNSWFIYQLIFVLSIGGALAFAFGVPHQLQSWFSDLKQAHNPDDDICDFPADK